MTTQAGSRTSADTGPEVVARTPVVDENREAGSATSATGTPSRFRRWLEHERTRWLVLVLVALVTAGLWWWHHLSGRETTDDAYVEGPIVALAPQVGGKVTSVLVEENQEVRADDLLMQIDPREYELAVQRAEADLAAAEAHVAAARAQVPIAETAANAGTSSAQAAVSRARASEAAAQQAVAAAQARLEQAEAAAEQAEQDLERMRTLVAKDEVPRASFDHALAAAKSARAAVTEARRGVELAESRRAEAQAAIGVAQAGLEEAGSGPRHVEAARAQLEVALAQLAQARARLGLARKDLEDTAIHAPSDGWIGMKNVNPGETVRAGQPVLALVRLEDVWITANFKETQLEGMRPGQRAKVHVDAYRRDFLGRIKSIGAATGSKFTLLPAQNATGNFVKVVQRVPVRIVLDQGQDPEHLLRPGMSVVPTVILE